MVKKEQKIKLKPTDNLVGWQAPAEIKKIVNNLSQVVTNKLEGNIGQTMLAQVSTLIELNLPQSFRLIQTVYPITDSNFRRQIYARTASVKGSDGLNSVVIWVEKDYPNIVHYAVMKAGQQAIEL